MEFQEEGFRLSWGLNPFLARSEYFDPKQFPEGLLCLNSNLESGLLTTPVREEATPTSTRGKGATVVFSERSPLESRAQGSGLGQPALGLLSLSHCEE